MDFLKKNMYLFCIFILYYFVLIKAGKGLIVISIIIHWILKIVIY